MAIGKCREFQFLCAVSEYRLKKINIHRRNRNRTLDKAAEALFVIDGGATCGVCFPREKVAANRGAGGYSDDGIKAVGKFQMMKGDADTGAVDTAHPPATYHEQCAYVFVRGIFCPKQVAFAQKTKRARGSSIYPHVCFSCCWERRFFGEHSNKRAPVNAASLVLYSLYHRYNPLR